MRVICKTTHALRQPNSLLLQVKAVQLQHGQGLHTAGVAPHGNPCAMQAAPTTCSSMLCGLNWWHAVRSLSTCYPDKPQLALIAWVGPADQLSACPIKVDNPVSARIQSLLGFPQMHSHTRACCSRCAQNMPNLHTWQLWTKSFEAPWLRVSVITNQWLGQFSGTEKTYILILLLSDLEHPHLPKKYPNHQAIGQSEVDLPSWNCSPLYKYRQFKIDQSKESSGGDRETGHWLGMWVIYLQVPTPTYRSVKVML